MMHKNRLEAFSDGVMAVIITVMVLELKVPHGVEFSSLVPLMPKFLCYILSFIYVGIYWNNHHHLFQVATHVNGKILWANSHLLFWLSLVPFVTAWSGENHFAAIPVLSYGFILMMCGLSYRILVLALLNHHGKSSKLGEAIGRDFKGIVSIVLYILGMILSCYLPALALIVYLGVALIWIVPDKRMERISL